MKYLYLFILLLTSCQPSSKNASQQGKAVNQKSTRICYSEAELKRANNIVGGQIVNKNDSDSKLVFALVSSSDRICTAAAIAKNVVLTAAHCVTEPGEDFYLAFYNSLSCESGYSRNFHSIKATQVIIHEQYNPNLKPEVTPADIALVFLESDIPEGYKIYNIAHPDAVNTQTNMLLYGYGITGSQQGGKGILRKTLVMPNDFSIDLGSKKVFISQKSGPGICKGDSGGPSFVEVNGELQILGVSSYVHGPENDICNDQGVQTLAYSYVDWIQSKIK